MPEIPEYFKRGRLAAASIGGGAASAPFAAAAIGEAGAVMTQFGLGVLEQLHKSEAVTQFNNFKAKAFGVVNEYKKKLDPNTDTAEWEKGLNDELVALRQSMPGELTNPDAKTNSEAWIGTKEATWKNEMFWAARGAKLEQDENRMEANVST